MDKKTKGLELDGQGFARSATEGMNWSEEWLAMGGSSIKTLNPSKWMKTDESQSMTHAQPP